MRERVQGALLNEKITSDGADKRNQFWKFLRESDWETVATKLVIVCLTLLPIMELFMSLLNKKFYLQEEIVEIFGLLSCIWVGVLMWRKRKIEIYVSDILLGMLFGFAILSFIFSKDINASIYGYVYRYRETIIVIFGYYSVALLTSRISKVRYRKQILLTFLILGMVEITVGILQFFGCWPYAPLYDPHTFYGKSAWGVQEWAFGFTEHFNFFAALTVIFTALAAGKYLLCEGKKSFKYLGLTAYFFFGVMTTYTRIGWLGTIGFWGVVLLLYIIAKKIKIFKVELKLSKIVALLLLFVMIFSVSMLMFPELQDNVQQSIDEIESENMDKLGTGRMLIWREGLETVPKWWYVGTGFDNYLYAFYWDNPEYSGFSQSKGHNEYIHILVTQGVFSVSTLFGLIIYNLITSSKRYLVSATTKEEQEITFMLLIMYAGYLCQALANSSVTNVAIYNWVIAGLLLYVEDKKLKWSKTITVEVEELKKRLMNGSKLVRIMVVTMLAMILFILVFLL